MSLAKYISDFMLSCPYIAIKGKDMHIDNTKPSPTNYSIDNEMYQGGLSLLPENGRYHLWRKDRRP